MKCEKIILILATALAAGYAIADEQSSCSAGEFYKQSHHVYKQSFLADDMAAIDLGNVVTRSSLASVHTNDRVISLGSWSKSMDCQSWSAAEISSAVKGWTAWPLFVTFSRGSNREEAHAGCHPPVNVSLVVHYTPMTERKDKLLRQLSDEDFTEDIVWMQTGEWLAAKTDETTVERMKRPYWKKYVSHYYDQFAMLQKYGDFEDLGFVLTWPLINLGTKHADAWAEIIERQADIALVLEDDAVLGRNFTQMVTQFIHMAPSGWDIICIGDSIMANCSDINECRSAAQSLGHNMTSGEAFVYEKTFDASVAGQETGDKAQKGSVGVHNKIRLGDSYLISQKAARALLSSLPFSAIADMHLNAAIYHLNLTVHWVHPPIVTQEIDPLSTQGRASSSTKSTEPANAQNQLEALQGALKLRPDAAQLHLLHIERCQLLRDLGKPLLALEACRAALGIKQNHPRALAELAMVFFTQRLFLSSQMLAEEAMFHLATPVEPANTDRGGIANSIQQLAVAALREVSAGNLVNISYSLKFATKAEWKKWTSGLKFGHTPKSAALKHGLPIKVIRVTGIHSGVFEGDFIAEVNGVKCAGKSATDVSTMITDAAPPVSLGLLRQEVAAGGLVGLKGGQPSFAALVLPKKKKKKQKIKLN
jgi:GR25 family glycosyltransferase involved in LPS biosynthesis